MADISQCWSVVGIEREECRSTVTDHRSRHGLVEVGGLLVSRAISLRFREHISSTTGSEQNKSQVQDLVVFVHGILSRQIITPREIKQTDHPEPMAGLIT